jgi:hypothetical protein
MSFLLPLFLVGAGAVLAPIVFHLIRRQAKGEQVFSSLMFLEASPPTMMRRSRIDNWLLLLLRALAILLLTAAFARPFWKSSESAAVELEAKRIALLIDRSASMNREGLLNAVIDQAQSVIDKAPSNRPISLYCFDDRLGKVVSIEQADSMVPSERRALLEKGLSEIRFTHRRSDLGSALALLSDELTRHDSENDSHEAIDSEIVLISDFQAGSSIERLENHPWPAQCRLIVKKVDSKEQENISANILAASDAESTSVRLMHRGSSRQLSVDVGWKSSNDKQTAEQAAKIRADVPLGGAVIVKLSKPSDSDSILELTGDEVTFDNQRWFAKPAKRAFDVVCIDDKEREPPESLGYFFEQIPLRSEHVETKFIWREPTASEVWPSFDTTPFVVAGLGLTAEDATKARPWLEAGGHLLWVLDGPLVDADFKLVWRQLLDENVDPFDEASAQREALIGKIDFSDSLFRPFADPKHNDFTKIRFWKHRKVILSADADKWRIMASLDDGTPFLAERKIGRGKVGLMSAGWQPVESQFALSSKFVPIMAGLFQQALPEIRSVVALEVGERIEVEEGEVWFDPDGQTISSDSVVDSKAYFTLESPGFYRVLKGDISQSVAVNLPLSESDTRPMAIERLERLGVITYEIEKPERAKDRIVVRKNRELEKQQGLWRWFLIGTLGVIVIETFLGARRK